MVNYVNYPDEAFDYVNERWNLLGVYKYAINWKRGRDVRISVAPLLEGWLAEASLNAEISKVIESFGPNLNSKSYDTRARICLRWVHDNIKYVGDMTQWKTPEYWQSPVETIGLRTGDCEDGAILMYALCRLSGIPANRLMLLAGDVVGGGHCYLAYRPQINPIAFTFLDWCYWYDNRAINYRPSFFIYGTKITGGDERYLKMWFGFNEDRAYYRLNEVKK